MDGQVGISALAVRRTAADGFVIGAALGLVRFVPTPPGSGQNPRGLAGIRLGEGKGMGH
jgi:hypothetical protein